MPADRREPRLQRHLPQSFLNAVETRHGQGRPKLYTEKELETIVSYVSRRPQHHPLGTRLQFPDPEKFEQDTRAIQDRVRTERAQTLADRIEKPSLKERIADAKATATYTPIARKPLTLDFKKLTTDDLVGILKPKVRATFNRLKVLYEVYLTEILTDPDNQLVTLDIVNLRNKLEHFLEHSHEVVSGATRTELQSLDWGLRAIGLISFTGLRRNFSRISVEVQRVATFGYFDLKFY